MSSSTSSEYYRHYEWDQWVNGNQPTHSSSATTRFSRSGFVNNSEKIAHWRRVIANGENATTNANGELHEITQVPALLDHGFQYKFTTPPNGYRRTRLEGNLLTVSIPGSGIPTLGLVESSATNQALTRYYSAVSAMSSTFKGMVFTGELRETLSMIRHPARALRNGIGDYLGYLRRYGRQVAKHKRPSFIRKTWLEYSFGWKPLIADLDSAIDSFYRSKWVRPIFDMVKGTGRDMKSLYTPRAQVYDVGSGHWVSCDTLTTEEVFVRYFGIVKSSGAGAQNTHSGGFAPWEFVPTIWELIPFSFLADYFTNIGDILSSWSYRFIAPSWTSRTIRREYKTETSNIDYYFDPSGSNDGDYTHWQSGSPGYASYRCVTFSRLRTASLILPSFEVQVPGRWNQWVNILALSRQSRATSKALSR